ncbi:SDR family NAD(P)-dependent oxidoreductase [Pseudomonas fluorescens]|jgi:2-hydroxycyclohexanecarboxyl-CoA dehydrogenase|uniref:SDR family NAD(P)-dependent oxidoreductase n=1 Tax=Pseudomonas fluorescens TaxID=294 RepID=UPI001914D71A|nr:SDR family oxidoreductase [Pseudomonas fluorescens]
MGQLNGKVAVVLGASTDPGMGSAIARLFAAQGAKVLVAARRTAPLEQLAWDIGGSWQGCDLTCKTDLDRLAQVALQRYGRLDIAVNATGVGLSKPFAETQGEDLDDVYRTLFKGPFQFLQSMLPAMSSGGAVIMLSSAIARIGFTDQAAYGACKAAGEHLVRAVANEYGDFGIRVNSIAPGLTDSGMTQGYTDLPGVREAFQREYPLGRLGTVADVAQAALFLASDGCFMTGQTLQVNGGLTLRRNPTFAEIQAAVAAARPG